MKKIYINAYTKKNLGDDLFLYLVANRYKNTFFTISDVKYNSKYFPPNLKIKKSFLFKALNKILKMLTLDNFSLQCFIKNRFDICLNLGGSIFIENNNLAFWKKNIHNNLINKKGYNFVIGSNVGPYKNKEFIELLRKDLFSDCIDVCFRDNYSYDIFSELNNTRVSPDIVFSLDLSNVIITDNKKVVISVINCSNRNIDKKLYEKSIINMIYKLDSLGYEIVLMSFCKKEGDEKAIKSILRILNGNLLNKKIKKYLYRGNIEEALNIIGDSQIVVGSRFHANILGLIMNKVVIPMAYSDKTLNVLKDLNFKGKIFDVRTNDIENIGNITNEDLNYHLDVTKQIIESSKHFMVLDRILKKEGEINE